jgi:hypothetical protein
MSNVNNLQRDMLWSNQSTTGMTWPSTSSRTNSDGVVNENVGTMHSASTTHSSATNTSIGIMMAPPDTDEDYVAYKVKVSTSLATQLHLAKATSQSGTDDTYSDSQFIPLQAGEYEEVISILTDGHTEPLFFGVRSPGTSTFIYVNMSVQRLNTAPPNFQSKQS